MKEEFLWGAATSAHQVEGGNLHNDWWAWEKAHAEMESSGKAADHWNRWREDFDLAVGLGHTAHRLSLEWSRIEPQKGQWNRTAVQHYREVLEGLRERGLKSFVTLHHFTNPQWLADQGGWLDSETSELFARYARFVAQELGDLVDFWVTINEPMVYATQSYWRAAWPPQHKSLVEVWRVVRQMAAGHRKAYRLIHQTLPEVKVGIAKHLIAYSSAEKIQNWWFNQYFFQSTKQTHDFIGVNYYFPSRWHEYAGEKSDLGWPIYPDGLRQVLLEVKQHGVPIYITENGLADADDSRRADFIRDHLRAVEAAQAEGVDVRGYLHWSLLDNFEWAEGFKPRFGLVEVDYDTFKRSVRPSALVYKAIIEQARRKH